MKKSIIPYIILIFLSAPLLGKGPVVRAKTSHEILKILSHLKEGAIIFIDVDETLITPRSKIFRFHSSYCHLIDDLKKNKDQYPNFDTILSHWRLQRKVMLVMDEWPEIIEKLKQKNGVYGLTKMNTGKFGDIPSLEKWRAAELTKMGIVFTPFFDGVLHKTLLQNPHMEFPAKFHEGIFITGSFSKGEVVEAYIRTFKPTQIVLIDDLEEQIKDVEHACLKHGVPYLGILFKGAELIKGVPDPKIAECQKETLLNQSQWLEDEDAEALCGG